MFVEDGSVEMEVIRETLRTCALADRDHTRLLGMQNATLFTHRLGIGHGG